MKKIFIAFTAFLLIAGCANNKTLDAETAAPYIKSPAPSPISVDVIDKRPYVINQEKSPGFYGISRNGLGMGFANNLANDLHLDDYLQKRITQGLTRSNIAVEPDAGNKLEIVLHEWQFKSQDAWVTFVQNCKYNVTVKMSQGGEVKEKHYKGKLSFKELALPKRHQFGITGKAKICFKQSLENILNDFFNPESSNVTSDSKEQIRKLNELLEEGLITEDQYQKQLNSILQAQ